MLSIIGQVLLAVGLAALASAVIIRVRRRREVREPELARATEKSTDWSLLIGCLFFAGYGLKAAITGSVMVELEYVSGTHVRIAGVMLSAIAVAVAVHAVFKK